MKKENAIPRTKGEGQRAAPETLQTLPTRLLEQAAEEAERRVARLKDELAAQHAAVAAAEQEQHLLDTLLALRGGRALTEAAGSSPASRAQPAKAGPNPGAGHALLAEAIGIMEKAGRALHISELMRLLTERSVAIPGSGNQANVISYLRRDGRIVRPSRGMYGLRTWGLQEMPCPKRKKTRRRKRVPRSQTQHTEVGM